MFQLENSFQALEEHDSSHIVHLTILGAIFTHIYDTEGRKPFIRVRVFP